MEQSTSNSSNNTNPPVHSQVMKIKQESNFKIVDWYLGHPELRPVLNGRQLSRSPLGLSGRPISVGDS
ncbi:hypothetical protein K2173_027164 [Erythroxylum novogranatense]|uniref:Uncharacterized protein n=1 Tax=Erythroxylum novogranatense TaxID=1862640 RepID=A0AAV8TYA5_9ROSI|nr:hypothetical protein K2173_027164 [Erythroxylum novogranatense]